MTETFEIFPCDLCKSTEAIEVPHAREYTGGQPIHICTRCGFVYVRERRSATAIADTWSDTIFGAGYTAALPAVRARLTFVAEFLHQSIGLPKKSVCDIGAGEGVFLDMLRSPRYGASVFGIEPSKKNCALMTAMDIENVAGTIEDYAARDTHKKFDVVTITWTIENCQSPRRMLAIAHDLLNDGGHIVVATGSRILVPFKKPLHYYLGKNPGDSHAFRFSAKTLAAMLAVSHFATTHENRYLDHDILCMIAEKKDAKTEIPLIGDDARAVADFFERWHKETQTYYPSV